MVLMSPRGDAVQFEIEVGGKTLSCSITRTALENHFWLEKWANEARTSGSVKYVATMLSSWSAPTRA
jgi:hypothetical protein